MHLDCRDRLRQACLVIPVRQARSVVVVSEVREEKRNAGATRAASHRVGDRARTRPEDQPTSWSSILYTSFMRHDALRCLGVAWCLA